MIMLISASFVGCIEDSSDDLNDDTTDDSNVDNNSQDDNTINPVGTNGTANMAPYVDAGVWDDNVEVRYNSANVPSEAAVFVHWAANDFDGTIESAGFDLDLDMTIDVPVGHSFGVLLNQSNVAVNQTLVLQNEYWQYDVFNGSDGSCGLIFHYTFAFIAIDDAGSSGIELVQYVLPEKIEYGEIMDLVDEGSGVLGINNDHLEVLNGTCGNGDSFDTGIDVALFVSQDANDDYNVEIIKVTGTSPLLNDLSFFLRDGSGSTYVGGNGFGEIAMQILGGEPVGIDTSYNGPETVLQNRTNDVQDCSQFPVRFSDNDLDGRLSAGDAFFICGPNSGPAEDGWKLDIQFDLTGDIIGSARLL